jgi:SAM-dependent methyltransferase
MAKIDPIWTDLTFNSPLDDVRVERLVGAVGPLAGARVVEVGCGWGELLLRFAAAEPSVRAVGIDRDAAAVGYGSANAAARGLAQQVELVVGDAAGWEPGAADVAVCVGASHALGGTPQALAWLRAAVRPGGRVIFGEGIWERPPTGAATAALGGDPAEFGTLADLVALAAEAGLRPWDVSVASVEEWDAFESGYARGWERWLRANPDDPEADTVRADADTHRERWLRGYRGVLGFAYLVLT